MRTKEKNALDPHICFLIEKHFVWCLEVTVMYFGKVVEDRLLRSLVHLLSATFSKHEYFGFELLCDFFVWVNP